MIARQIIDAMGDDANIAISQALSKGAFNTRAVPRTEPGLVAAVHLRAIATICSNWSAHLAAIGLSIRMTGVFCHQSPMVIFKSMKGRSKRCELADLLIVVDTRTPLLTKRKAVLIQAKMAAAVGTVSPKGISSLTQLELYQRLPLFDFEQRSYGLSGIDLNVGSSPGLSGAFGVIDRHGYRSAAPIWTQHPATPTPAKTHGHPELGDYLANMVAGAPSFGRDADLQLASPWSNMIEILLRETLTKKFRHDQSLGSGSYPRTVIAYTPMNGDMSFLQASRRGDGPPDLEIIPIDGDPTGISTLYIEIDQTDAAY